MNCLALFRAVPQQSHTNLSICSVHYVNHFLSQFELFIRGVGDGWSQHCDKFSSPPEFFAEMTS